MNNGEQPKALRFADTFATIANNHHLSLSTQRSYYGWARNLIKWAGIKSAAELADNPADLFTRYLSKLANDDMAHSASRFTSVLFSVTIRPE